MSHLDTAYKLGAAAAWEDFQREVEKQAQGAPPVAAGPAQPPPKPVTPPPKPPGSAVPPPAPEGVVNPGPKAGLVNRGY